MERVFGAHRWVLGTVSLALMLIGASCAGPSTSANSSNPVNTGANSTGTATADPDRARMPLEEIGPEPVFPPADAAVSLTQTQDPRAIRYMDRAKQRWGDRNWSEVLSSLDRAVQIDPDWVEARVLYARAALRLGNATAATEMLNATLSREPRNVAAHRLLGEIAVREGRSEDAIAAFRRVLIAAGDDSISPDVTLARLSLAQVLEEAGHQLAAALQYDQYLAAVDAVAPDATIDIDLGEAVELYRGTAAAALGELRTKLGDYDKAVAAFDRAVREKPEDDALARRRLLALARAGRLDEALTQAASANGRAERAGGLLELIREICDAADQPQRFEAELLRLAKAAPDSQTALAIARQLLQRKKFAEATDLLQADIASHGSSNAAVLLLAESHQARGNFDAAYAVLLQAAHERPELIEPAWKQMGESAVAPKFAEAARDAAQTSPNDAVTRLLLGRLLASRGEWDAAVTELRAAIKLDDGMKSAFGPLAGGLCAMKEWDEAVRTTDAALEKGARDASVYMARGRAMAALDRDASAEEAFLAAFELDRKNAEPLYLLAELAERRGQHRRCEQLYRRILDDVDPRHLKAREKLVLYYLNRAEIDKCREYFSDFEAMHLAGPPVERCRAMLALTTSGATTAQERFDEYVTALRKILIQYPRDDETYVEIARSYATINDYDRALTEVNAALTIKPDDLSARELRANLLVKLLRFPEAAAAVRSLLRDRPRDLGYLQDLLNIADSEGDWTTAADLLRGFIARDDLKEQREAFTAMLIAALSQAEAWDDAVNTAKKWFDDSPEDAVRRSTYLATLGRAKRHDEAIREAERLLEGNNTDRVLQIELLRRLQDARRYTEAIQLTLGWLSDEVDDVDLNAALIRMCWSARQWDEAIEIARINAERSPSRTTFDALLGDSYRYARRFDDAVRLYRDRVSAAERRRREIETELRGGVEKSKERPLMVELREAITQARASNYSLVGVMISAERYEEAERAVNKLLRPELAARESGQPFDAGVVTDMRNLLSEIYQDTERPAQALQQLEAIYELNHDDPGINNNLGYFLTEMGTDLPRAERMIRYSLAQNPKSNAALDSLGWVLYKQGKFGEAAYYLRQALKLADSEEPVLHDHFGDALYRDGKADAAAAQWRLALEICAPEHDPPPDHDRKRLHEAVRKKLAALEKGGTVTTAVIVGSAATQPASSPAP